MIQRGGLYEVDFTRAGPNPCVVLTRQEAIPVPGSVTAALVTSTRRGHPAEVALDDDGLENHPGSVVNCDDLATLPKQMLGRSGGYLSAQKSLELDRALLIAFGLD